MKLPQDAPQFLDKIAYLIVASSEEGIIYRIQDGTVEQVDLIEQHLQPYSDDEGFFFGGIAGSGGAPKERNDKEENLKALRKKIAHELDELIKKDRPQVLYIFEPEHHKGRVEEELQQHHKLPIHNVRYGNYISESPHTLVKYITEYIEEHKIDLDDTDYEKDLKKF